MGGECGEYVGEERCIRSLGWKSDGKRQLARSRRRLEDNIKIGLHEVDGHELD